MQFPRCRKRLPSNLRIDPKNLQLEVEKRQLGKIKAKGTSVGNITQGECDTDYEQLS